MHSEVRGLLHLDPSEHTGHIPMFVQKFRRDGAECCVMGYGPRAACICAISCASKEEKHRMFLTEEIKFHPRTNSLKRIFYLNLTRAGGPPRLTRGMLLRGNLGDLMTMSQAVCQLMNFQWHQTGQKSDLYRSSCASHMFSMHKSSGTNFCLDPFLQTTFSNDFLHIWR
jgi:hypothetical protein